MYQATVWLGSGENPGGSAETNIYTLTRVSTGNGPGNALLSNKKYALLAKYFMQRLYT